MSAPLMKPPLVIGCSARSASLRTGSYRHAGVALIVLGAASCHTVEPTTRARVRDPVQEGAEQDPVTVPAAPPSKDSVVYDPTPYMPEKPRPLFSGTLQSRWRLRDSGNASDQDIYEVLALEVGDASRDRVSGHFLGRFSADIDGQGDSDSQAKFSSLQDTHHQTAYFDLYEASADVQKPFDAPVRARIGRQTDYATPEFAHFDGLRVESDPMGKSRIIAGAYGGVPVRHYEATTIKDQIAGAWADARPWTGGRVRADWMHVHQDEDGPDFYNDLLGLALWQRLSENLQLDARYTRLESENRDVRLDATWQDGEGDLVVQAGYYRLMNPLSAFASEFDPFFETLQTFEPYNQFRFLFSKSLAENLRVDLGGDLRRLDDSGDEGQYNHDYDRGFATLVISDMATKGLDLSLTGDAWESDDQDIRTWGIDLAYTPDVKWRMSLGSAYALYKFNVFQDEERDDVRTWYTRVRRVLSAAWTVELDYAYEDDDFDDYQAFLAGATWHF